jgi:hypothetical protein
MKTLKDLSIYGIFIPIIVVLLAEVAITVSCKYYWGEHVLGFKLSIWQLTLSICLSVIYYLFCIVYKIVKKKADKRLITLLFVLMPILVYHVSSSYDYRITISFSLFHCTFYFLFFVVIYFRYKL